MREFYWRDNLDFDTISSRVEYNPKTGVFKSRLTGRILKSKTVHNRHRIRIKINGKTNDFHAGRVAILLVTGNWPSGYVDHINGDQLDQRYENLRVVTCSGNQQNRSMKSYGKTGVLGVYFNEKKEKYEVSFKLPNDGKRKFVGSFKTLEEAREASIKARKEAYPFFSGRDI